MKTVCTLLAAGGLAVGAAAVPASAAPITLPSSLQAAVTSPVETVQYRRWGGWRAWGPGLAAGAIVGGAIAASRPWYGYNNYYDDYAYASPYGAYAYSPYGTGPSGYNSYNYNYAPGYSYNYVPAYSYSYGPGVYNSYAYSPGTSYAAGDAVAYCKQRFRSYDPASGTYLGYDGQRHPCP
jgi:hypothetical protein